MRRSFEQIFTVSPRTSLSGVTTFAHHLIVNELGHVRSRLSLFGHT
jgi:hypothetical protein